MKKLSLAIIIATVSISLVGCTNSDVVSTNNNSSNVNISADREVSNKITIEQAKEIALKHAGLTKDQVSFLEIENDIDDGAKKYNIEFYCNGKEYDYEINKANGQIIKYDYDLENTYISNNNQSNNQINVNNTAKISEEEAKQIALSHAGLSNSEVTFKRIGLDFDNGIQKYEVEFYHNYKKYSYEIDANTGDVLTYEQDS